MRIEGYLWLKDIVEKLDWKHNVSQEEAEQVIENEPLFRFAEKGHQVGENVYAALGQTDGGRYLIVFFIYKTDKRALLVSARDMDAAERKRYERR